MLAARIAFAGAVGPTARWTSQSRHWAKPGTPTAMMKLLNSRERTSEGPLLHSGIDSGGESDVGHLHRYYAETPVRP